MRVLSLFDGIGCAYQALQRAGKLVELYDASEVDERAMFVSNERVPRIAYTTKVEELRVSRGHYDLLIGGGPCQDLSRAFRHSGGGRGLEGKRSGLFWEYLRVLEEAQPTYFVFENVASMTQENKDIISEALGRQPLLFNAALVSAQARKRLFWTNIPQGPLPEHTGVYVKDVLEENTGVVREYDLASSAYKPVQPKKVGPLGIQKVGYFGNGAQGERVYSIEHKSCTLSHAGGGLGGQTGLYKTLSDTARQLTPVECERLMGLPDNYTMLEGLTASMRRRLIGNAFNVDVVAHILRNAR